MAKTEKRVLKIQYGDLINSKDQLAWLERQKLPQDLFYKYIAFMTIVLAKSAEFDRGRDAIIQRYANGASQLKENTPEFVNAVREINKFLEAPIEVPDIGIRWEDVKALDWPSPAYVHILMWLIPDVPIPEL